MTNSTDETPEVKQEEKQEEKPKKQKKKGPIRFEAIIPIAIIIALLYGYFALFFDSNLKSAIEYGMGKANGAEVNVGNVKTSFFGGSFLLQNLQVTDKEQPEQNILQIGKMRFQFLWDALLRAKFVVDDATIDNIQIYTPRKRAGKVFPKEEKKATPKSETMAKVEKAVIDQTKEDFSQNFLGDIATILEGTDPTDQLENIKDELAVHKKVRELEKELKVKEEKWENTIKNLSHPKEIGKLIQEAKSVKINTKKPLEAIKAINRLSKIVKQIEKKIKEYKDASKQVKADINKFKNDIKSVEKMAKEDVANLQKRVKLPDLNVSDFSAKLFGRYFEAKVGTVKKYMETGRQYLPPPKTKEEKAEKAVAKPERGKGVNVSFPKEKGYPLFWLKKAGISSKASDSEFSGNVSGFAENFSTEPKLVGKPAIVTFKGDFPKQSVYGVNGRVAINHHTKNPNEVFAITVKQFEMKGLKLSDSKDAKLAIKKSVGVSKIDGRITGNRFEVKLNNFFKGLVYDVDAKNKILRDVLLSVTNDLKVISLNARAFGEWGKTKWDIKSNLGKELNKGIKKHVQKKIDEAKRKLEKRVKDEIAGEKAKLTKKFDGIKAKFEEKLNKQKEKLDKEKDKLQAKLKESSKKSQNKQKKKAKDALKKLKKKFKFKF